MFFSWEFSLSFVAAFFCGAIPTAFIIAKKAKGIDIRQHGSSNVGATNAFRVLGKKMGALVFALDLLKGYLPAKLLSLYFFNNRPELALWIGLGAVLGHVFTPFLSFKGGKGIATGAGALLAAYPLIFLWALLAWVLVFAVTKIVSISSLAAILSLVLWGKHYQVPDASMAFFVLAAVFLVWTHRSNIQRLLKGEEKKVINR